MDIWFLVILGFYLRGRISGFFCLGFSLVCLVFLGVRVKGIKS